jgi:glutamate/tyrosine decarboxylase-like PLP-dependent enzyme
VRVAEVDLEHAQLLARLITAEPTLELLAPVELSTVCFRWNDASEAELDRRNAAILREVLRRGRVCLSNASIHGTFALRACIINHRTEPPTPTSPPWWRKSRQR